MNSIQSTRWTSVLTILALAGAAGCGGDSVTGPTPTPPSSEEVPGWLDVQLSTPNADDGGIIFTVGGGAIDSMESVHQGFSAAVNDSIWRILLTGELSDGVIARLHVPDVNASDRYSPEILQVAAENSFAQRDLTAYDLEIVAP